MLCKVLIINMLDYKFKRFIFNIKITENIEEITNAKISFIDYYEQ